MNARSSRLHWTRALALLGLGTLWFSGGCSVLYDLNTTQCEVDVDCEDLGFRNTRCVNKVCVPEATAGSGGVGGVDTTGGIGGAIAGSGGSSGGNAGTAGNGGAGGMSGDAGADGGPDCTTNAQCIDANLGQPFVCKDGSCVNVVTEDCPILLPHVDGIEVLRAATPILLGGMANLSVIDAYEAVSVVNWDLAITEFNEQQLGGGLDSGKSPVLALVCNGVAEDVLPSIRHLALDLGVPALLSTMPADRLLAAYDYTASEEFQGDGGNPVFFMSTVSADRRLADLLDRGLVWHMLGSPRVLAETTAALVRRIEPYVQAQRVENHAITGVDDPETPLRVTLITSDETAMADISYVLTSGDTANPEVNLSFNGQLAITQPGDFREVDIESIRLHTDPEVQPAIDDLRAFPPHIVVVMGASEILDVLSDVEAGWGADAVTQGRMRPYFVMSHFLASSVELPTVVGASSATPPLWERVVGVNFATASDARSQNLYAAYVSRLLGFYDGMTLEDALPGTENHYDGAYSLLYALVAARANGSEPTALGIRDGLQDRVFSTELDAESIDIGPAHVADAVQTLSLPSRVMALYGTMGPPRFERSSGTRVSATSAWCIDPLDMSSPYVKDGLLYDNVGKEFVDPTGGPGSCLAKYY
jgi:hypothetical protein